MSYLLKFPIEFLFSIWRKLLNGCDFGWLGQFLFNPVFYNFQFFYTAFFVMVYQSLQRLLSQLGFLNGNWRISEFLHDPFLFGFFLFGALDNYFLLLILLLLNFLNRHFFNFLRTRLFFWGLNFNFFLLWLLFRCSPIQFISFKLFTFFSFDFLLHGFFVNLLNSDRCIFRKFLLVFYL